MRLIYYIFALLMSLLMVGMGVEMHLLGLPKWIEIIGRILCLIPGVGYSVIAALNIYYCRKEK